MTKIAGGSLRHEITWLNPVVLSSPGSFGEDVEGAPTTVVTCRAQITPLAGRELAAAQQLWSEARYHIAQRYETEGLTTAMRISCTIDGTVRTLDVLDIQTPDRKGRPQIVIAKDHVE
jgi:head-tail adaptor